MSRGQISTRKVYCSGRSDALKTVTRKNLGDFTVGDIWSGHSSRANVSRIKVDGVSYILKDFAGNGLLKTSGLGRFLLANEWRIYKRLKGIPGIPEVFCFLDDDAFIMEYIQGKPLKEYKWDRMNEKFILGLEELVRAMHGRGIVHLDLQQRRNILVSPDERPYLIDFATSIDFGTSAFAKEFLIPVFGTFDRTGVIKVKWRHAPQMMTDQDNRTLKFMRKFRKLWVFTPTRIRKEKHSWHQEETLT